MLDGQAVKSCTMFAVQADGSDVKTIEDLLRTASYIRSGRILGETWTAMWLLHAGNDRHRSTITRSQR